MGMTLQYKQELEPNEILDQAISQGLTDFYVAYSGGKDSGDCLCGCFADKSELKLLQMFHPEVYDKITYLENKIKSEGSDDAKKNATWGKYHQATNDIKAQTTIESYLCSDCILDRSATDDDTKKFNDEFENIEAKLDKL